MRPRLSDAALGSLPKQVERPSYDRTALVPGIVHFGPGAFHRAHQAVYFDEVLAEDRRWAISAVSLNSYDLAEALRLQDRLYTLARLGEAPRFRIIGSLAETLTRADAAAITDRLAAPTTRLVTATVTEKGYCLDGEGRLARDHPAILADLAALRRPRSFIGRLVEGLRARRCAGAGGLTILSCDNLASNGQRLARAVTEFADLIDPALAGWIGDEVRFPSCMVDSITPATDEALRVRVAEATGFEDAWPIQREDYTQWVIEDDFVGERPPLELAGVQFVRSVSTFETAKLRLLNGAHSSLAYLGLLLGHDTVSDGMADEHLGRFIEALMRVDIAATLTKGGGLSLNAYIDAILLRFRNPAIRHLLSQIAWDGSQKLPFRLLGTILDARAAGRPIDRLVVPVAAWIRFVGLPRPPAPPIVDPFAPMLAARAASGDVEELVRDSGIFPAALGGDPHFLESVVSAYRAMEGGAAVRGLLAETT